MYQQSVFFSFRLLARVRSIAVAYFCSPHALQWHPIETCSLRFMQFGRNYGLECTVKVLNKSEVCFFQVKFVKFLRISENLTKVCDICCAINDFIAVNQQFLNFFF